MSATRATSALSVVFESLLPHDATGDLQFRSGFIDGEAIEELLGEVQLEAPVFLDLMRRLLARADLDPSAASGHRVAW